jgi:hypothetical protein
VRTFIVSPRRISARWWLFYVHLITGLAFGLYFVLIGVTGSVFVFELANGKTGEQVNAIGTLLMGIACITGIVCLMWWNRSLVKSWRRRRSSATMPTLPHQPDLGQPVR